MGNVTDIVLDRNGTAIRGVDIDGKEMEADAVVIAMGPWSALARRWLPVPDVYGLKGHSIVLRPSAPVPAEAIFADVETEDGMSDTPEIFPRPDGTVYLCGLSSQNPLPDDPALVATASAASNQLRAIAGMLSPLLSDADTVAAQACYRPVTRDGLPVMGAMPGIEGAYIATGHSVWGILNAPASGEALAGLILDGQARNTDLSPFDPCRFSKAQYSLKEGDRNEPGREHWHPRSRRWRSTTSLTTAASPTIRHCRSLIYEERARPCWRRCCLDMHRTISPPMAGMVPGETAFFLFPHYHSTAHEVLGICQGEAKVRLGGDHGLVMTVKSGDALVLPAGTGHQNLGSSPDLLVVGAYPGGMDWDLCRGEPGVREDELRNIQAVPLPENDPLFGRDGPLMHLWRPSA